MTQYVALFRGINVGGKHIVPMKDLRDMLAELACKNVQTYIQSGNAVFESISSSGELAAAITSAVGRRFGFEPEVLVLKGSRFREIASANPFKDADSDPKFVHVSFLTGKPEFPDLDALDKLKSPTEAYELGEDAFYLHAPNGIARSKLVEKVERHLGVSTTSRNLRTISKLLDLLDS